MYLICIILLRTMIFIYDDVNGVLLVIHDENLEIIEVGGILRLVDLSPVSE